MGAGTQAAEVIARNSVKLKQHGVTWRVARRVPPGKFTLGQIRKPE
jgi:hypothetical protein